MPFNPSASLGVLSGLALVTLGLVVLTIRPIRAPAVAFSIFAALWGLMQAGTNMTRMLDDPDLRFWATFMLILATLLYVPLLYFATTYPWASAPLTRHWAWWLVLATPAVIMLMLLGTNPRLFIRDLGVAGASPAEWWGPLYWPLSFWTSSFVFILAAGTMVSKLFDATRHGQREQVALAAAALLVYVSYQASASLSPLLSTDQGTQAFWLRLTSIAAATAVVIWAVVGVVRRPTLPWRDLLLGACLVPYGVGMVELMIGSLVDTWIWTTGVWRLAFVGLFLFGLARHRIFDAEVRIRSVAAPAAYVMMLFLAVGVLVSLFGNAFTARPLLGTLAFVGVAGAVLPSTRLGSAIAVRVASHVQDPRYLARRKLEVYRAALQEAHDQDEIIDPDDLFLADLRRRLGISKQEHRALLLVLQTDARLSAAVAESSDIRQQAQELEDHLYGTTHDMKTPLMTLDWLTKDLEEALKDSMDDPTVRDTLEHMRTTVGGMDRLVQDLLLFARADAEPTGAETTDVEPIVEEVAASLESWRKRSHAHIVVEAWGKIPMAPSAFRHVVHNLVSNAIKYGGDGVTVLVRGQANDGEYVFIVEDDGPGIEPSELGGLFEPFRRGASAKGTAGTGLGLALVHRVVRRHGGTISVKVVRPHGLRFVVRVPVGVATAAAHAARRR